MENEEYLAFFDYLTKRDREVNKELEPYYERARHMEERNMNAYGQAKPYDKVLLKESATIYRLKRRVSNCASIEELIVSIEKDRAQENRREIDADLEQELWFITEYQNVKKQTESRHI